MLSDKRGRGCWNNRSDRLLPSDKRHPRPAEPYEVRPHVRVNTYAFQRKVAARTATVFQDVIRSKWFAPEKSASWSRRQINVEPCDSYEVGGYTPTVAAKCYTPGASHPRTARRTTCPGVIMPACDVLSWYARLYKTNRHVCGNWFVLGATAGGFGLCEDVDTVFAHALNLADVQDVCLGDDEARTDVPAQAGTLRRRANGRDWVFTPLLLPPGTAVPYVLTSHGINLTPNDE